MRTIKISLSNSKLQATIDEADFNELMTFGINARWQLKNGNVYAVGTPAIPIARFLMDAGTGQTVKYLDGDTLNVTRANLCLARGSGKFRARDLILDKQDQKAETPMSA
jgi:hypothetical protein